MYMEPMQLACDSLHSATTPTNQLQPATYTHTHLKTMQHAGGGLGHLRMDDAAASCHPKGSMKRGGGLLKRRLLQLEGVDQQAGTARHKKGMLP